MIPLSNVALFHQDIKGSELVILKGIGHVPMEEAPWDFVRALVPFLQKNNEYDVGRAINIDGKPY